jgi:hypothetical protein
MDDTGRLINRVTALDAPSPIAEDTLMDGYAHALALEAERTRLEQRFSTLAQAVAEDRDAQRLPELRRLRQQISRTDEELARLREVLAAVRRRLAAASAAAAAAENV